MSRRDGGRSEPIVARAAVSRRFGSPLVIEDVTIDPPGPYALVVSIEACAICHSDIAYMDGAWGGELPAIYGHEAAGRVAAVGAKVDDLAVGARVAVTLVRSCGTCRRCSDGLEVACDGQASGEPSGRIRDAVGTTIHQGMQTGAFAERVLVHRSQVVEVPESLPAELAALLACGVITGVGAVTNTAQVEVGAHVVVLGAGGVGLNTVQGAADAGAASIVAVDLVEAKLEVARRFGATHEAVAGEGVAATVRQATGEAMADYVFVTVGAAAAFDAAVDLLAPGGAIVAVGMPATGVTTALDLGMLAARNQRVLGSKMGTSRVQRDIPRLVAAFESGRLMLSELITDRFAFDDINRAIDDARAGAAIRNVVMFGD